MVRLCGPSAWSCCTVCKWCPLYCQYPLVYTTVLSSLSNDRKCCYREIAASVCLNLFFCSMFWSRPVGAPSNPGMLQDTTAQGKGDRSKRSSDRTWTRVRLSSVAAPFSSVTFPLRCNVLQHSSCGLHSLYIRQRQLHRPPQTPWLVQHASCPLNPLPSHCTKCQPQGVGLKQSQSAEHP